MARQYPDHSSINATRLGHKVPRWYAASALSANWWASACSMTSRWWSVVTSSQSRKVERKPCWVNPEWFILFKTANSDISDSCPPRGAGNTRLLSLTCGKSFNRANSSIRQQDLLFSTHHPPEITYSIFSGGQMEGSCFHVFYDQFATLIKALFLKLWSGKSQQKQEVQIQKKVRLNGLFYAAFYAVQNQKFVVTNWFCIKYGGEGGIDSLRSPLRGSPLTACAVCPTGCASCRTPVGGSHPPLRRI